MDSHQPMRVFVVDDHADTLLSTSKLLSLMGHSVAVADCAETALAQAPLFCPDVMLLDLAMPKTDGVQLARRLRQYAQFARTPMVAVSGYTDARHREYAAAAFDEFLAKPYWLDDLQLLFSRLEQRIAATRTSAERTRAVAAASHELVRKSREGLAQYRRNR